MALSKEEEMQKTFEVRVVNTQENYDWAVEQIEAHWDAKPGSDEFEYLMVLSEQVDRYEAAQFPVEGADPVDAILFHLDQNSLTQTDLADLLKSRSRASEILGRKKDLSITQVRILHTSWNLPAEVLIRPVRSEETCTTV
ncbi:MAG: transcriptional regulator [Rhodospirillaceae bacterium]|nr:transcriptional regulator [Rhodospirillaceae bacterium]